MPITLNNTVPAQHTSRNPAQETKHTARGRRVVIDGRMGIGKTSLLASCATPPLLLLTSGKQAKRGNS